MQAAKQLKTKIGAETITTGILVTNHLWPELVEICVDTSLDYLIIDMEHGAFSPELVCDVCALGRLIDFPVLIRPISTHYFTVRKAIDMGPCGLLLPGVEDPAMLDEVRDAIYLPPRGRRRPGGLGNRWVPDYGYSGWRTEVEDDFIVLPQIETRLGLERVEQIASHEIVTAMAIGPYDLSADLGVCGATNGPEVTAATQTIRQAAKAVDKNMWVIGDGVSLVQQGFSFICVAEPIALLEAALAGVVGQAKSSSRP